MQNVKKDQSNSKKFYEKYDKNYDSVKTKIVPRRESEIYNKRKSKYENGVVKVFLY